MRQERRARLRGWPVKTDTVHSVLIRQPPAQRPLITVKCWLYLVCFRIFKKENSPTVWTSMGNRCLKWQVSRTARAAGAALSYAGKLELRDTRRSSPPGTAAQATGLTSGPLLAQCTRDTGIPWTERCWGQHGCHRPWFSTQECDLRKARNSTGPLAFSQMLPGFPIIEKVQVVIEL